MLISSSNLALWVQRAWQGLFGTRGELRDRSRQEFCAAHRGKTHPGLGSSTGWERDLLLVLVIQALSIFNPLMTNYFWSPKSFLSAPFIPFPRCVWTVGSLFHFYFMLGNFSCGKRKSLDLPFHTDPPHTFPVRGQKYKPSIPCTLNSGQTFLLGCAGSPRLPGRKSEFLLALELSKDQPDSLEMERRVSGMIQEFLSCVIKSKQLGVCSPDKTLKGKWS